MKEVVMNDGTEKTVTDKHARNLVYNKLAEIKEEKKVPANKADKTKKETK